jgi:hypothetical protein
VNRLRNLLDLVVVLVLLTGLQAILAGIIAVSLPALLSCALHAATALHLAHPGVLADAGGRDTRVDLSSLQGTAKQAKGAAANLVAFWLVGLPLGALTCPAGSNG